MPIVENAIKDNMKKLVKEVAFKMWPRTIKFKHKIQKDYEDYLKRDCEMITKGFFIEQVVVARLFLMVKDTKYKKTATEFYYSTGVDVSATKSVARSMENVQKYGFMEWDR